MHDEFSEGYNRHMVNCLQRALCGRIKLPQRFDVVPQKLQAHRSGKVWWEQIDDAAAHAEIPPFLDQIRLVITALQQALNDFLALECDPRPQVETGALELRTGQDIGDDGLWRGDDGQGAGLKHGPQG